MMNSLSQSINKTSEIDKKNHANQQKRTRK